MRQISALKRVPLIVPAAAATTERTGVFDTAGAKNVGIVVQLGPELNTSSTNVKVSVLESDTQGGSYTSIGDAYKDVVVDNTAATVHTIDLPVNGTRKRWLQVKVTPDTTTNGPVAFSALAELDMGIKV